MTSSRASWPHDKSQRVEFAVGPSAPHAHINLTGAEDGFSRAVSPKSGDSTKEVLPNQSILADDNQAIRS
jgi:hypothetical protein